MGIYNDVSATGPIKDFTLSFKQEFSYQDTQCAGTADCSEGFLGSQCRDMCPGVVVDSGYTNAPMPSEGSCDGNGVCEYDSDGNPSCDCHSSHFGDSCDVPCPGIDPDSGEPCYGRGQCSYDSASNTASCTCDAGYVLSLSFLLSNHAQTYHITDSLEMVASSAALMLVQDRVHVRYSRHMTVIW